MSLETDELRRFVAALALDRDRWERFARESFTVEPTAIHRVLHAGEGAAVTIHAYSPPLRRTGAYRIDPDGVLARESQDYEVELRGEPALV
jgi:hypothetical protein